MADFIESFCKYYMCFKYNIGNNIDCATFCKLLLNNINSYIKNREFHYF